MIYFIWWSIKYNIKNGIEDFYFYLIWHGQMWHKYHRKSDQGSIDSITLFFAKQGALTRSMNKVNTNWLLPLILFFFLIWGEGNVSDGDRRKHVHLEIFTKLQRRNNNNAAYDTNNCE